jgi:hypothetical protein
MAGFAYRRVAAGEPAPGLIATTNDQSVGSAIDDIFLIAEYMPEQAVRDLVFGPDGTHVCRPIHVTKNLYVPPPKWSAWFGLVA